MRFFIPAVVAVSLASCTGATDSATGLAGTYTLSTVDGAPLPFISASGIIVRGSVGLQSNGRYTLSQTDSAVTGALSVFSSAGTWNVSENALVLHIDGGGVQLGLAYFDSLSVELRDHRNIYRRQ